MVDKELVDGSWNRFFRRGHGKAIQVWNVLIFVLFIHEKDLYEIVSHLSQEYIFKLSREYQMLSKYCTAC